jgi:hypothetical protein
MVTLSIRRARHSDGLLFYVDNQQYGPVQQDEQGQWVLYSLSKDVVVQAPDLVDIFDWCLGCLGRFGDLGPLSVLQNRRFLESRALVP